jgi:heterodisulfide reductase subunit A-like polyferredoxin
MICWKRVNHMTDNSPVGAVMVVGGGVGGIQASLDLAASGFKVYLVETRSAIGGHMAQLDKTFPTNDCAMCIVSPKLVEAGRHLNIDILTDTDVLSASGEAGHFSVEVRRKARYIDVAKCTGCGECNQVCPVVLPARFNTHEQGLAERRAAHRLYPQAVPNAFAIDKLGISPCRDACPTGQRAQGYIALIREGRYKDALRVIKEDNPFPGICGRICNHRCEDACNRNLIDDPLSIAALKRFVTDMVYRGPREPVPPAERTRPEEVAIIGAGPCGLTAARDLVREGYGVTVFEALPVAGGMLRVGVPEYRLPSWVIEREAQDILDEGVELKLNHRVEDLDSLFAQGFKAVLIAVGTHVGKRLPIPGADLDGVLLNTIFLRQVRLGEPVELGNKVVVLGGGNVAVDVARTAVRLGVPEVHMACLESRQKMPAAWDEVEQAVEEGVILHPGRTFKRILNDGDHHVGAIECQLVTSMEFDSEGRLNLTTEPDSEHIIECDTIVFSVGQAAGLAFIPADSGVGVTGRGTVAVNPNSLAATRPGVFAAGDSVSGTAFVVEGIASGHRAAASIHRYLQGEQLEPKPKPDLPVVKLTEAEVQEKMEHGEIVRRPRVPMPALDVQTRRSSFAEVDLGYNEELARKEAERCLACGHCSECLSCWYTCGVDAIDHDMVDRLETLDVGAIILAPGYEAYDARLSEELGFGRYPNVVNALQFERLLSASGPTFGHVQRPSDQQRPRKIAFLQCVGSRDQEHDYCSSICCMYATKEAIMACEHEPDTQVKVFMMDMRSFGKGYLEYYRRAQQKYGIEYVRCRVSALREDPETRNIIVRYAVDRVSDETAGEEDSSIRRQPTITEEEFDLVVLSVGVEIAEGVKQLGRNLGIEQDEHGFCRVSPFEPLRTSRPGVFACGPFVEPKDIPETVVEASGAAACAAMLLAPARGTQVREPAYPPERDISGEMPRVGVFICHCGSNIAGFVDVEALESYATTLPFVAHAERNLYTCSQDSIAHISQQIEEHGLNRVVVAACTPLTHEPLYRESLRMAGLNPYLFEMANIRNQCSWVHSHDRAAATDKAADLLRMAVARAARLQALRKVSIPVQKTALVLGGGVAGMTASLALAEQGFPVHLVERADRLGGNLWHVRVPLGDQTAGAENPQELLGRLTAAIEGQPLISVHLNTELVEHSGYRGNFTSRLRSSDGSGLQEEFHVRHGATVVATGGREYRGDEYLYGQDPRVVTGEQFEALLDQWRPDTAADDVVMILCVGPAEKYCGRICCTTALKNALRLKELNPDARVTILYRDIRAYGFRERLYTEARRKGVLFSRYDDQHRPEAQIVDGRLQVRAWEPTFGAWITISPDILMLSNPTVPSEGSKELATALKVSRDLDGFFLEAHVKLRPVDFATDGIYLAGAAHYPKFIGESVAQAQAAAARASTILCQDTLSVGGVVAEVDVAKCTACLTCVRVCPYHVPRINHELTGVGGIIGAAEIEVAECQGCGICVAECPARAIRLDHYTDEQMEVKIGALLELPALVPV